MTPLAIIPARAGSRRLPGKNHMEFADGESLTSLALKQARDSGIFGNNIVLSTDDPELFKLKVEWLIVRPPDLARGDTPSIQVIRHAALHMQAHQVKFDSVFLLQPTSPLRQAADIAACYELLKARGDAVVSVVETGLPEVFTLGHMGRMRPLAPTNDGYRHVVPNGAVYGLTVKAMDAERDWWNAGICYGYEMPPDRSVDIDTEEDLKEARTQWQARGL